MQLAAKRRITDPLSPPDPGRASTRSLPDGPAGVRATLDLMALLARRYKTDPRIRAQAAAIVQHLNQKDWIGEARAIHSFVRDHVRYVKDIAGVETLSSPDRTLAVRHGDCDDKATLAGALLLAIGHPVRFVATGQIPGEHSHVHVETRIGNKWMALETTAPVPAGWRPPSNGTPIIVTV